MKKYTHAWISLKAVEYLESLQGSLGSNQNIFIKKFLDFISEFPTTFVRGSWFPDSPIADNLQDCHTWKYYIDDDGKVEGRKTPNYHTGRNLVSDILDTKVKLDVSKSSLADRCEAISQQIRDTIIITNKVKVGDMVAFNNSQISLFFLMLSHYVADAHVPLHADARDFMNPPKVHDDLEKYWEKLVKKLYNVSTKKEQIDLDIDNKPRLKVAQSEYRDTIFFRVDESLKNTAVVIPDRNKWKDYLGSGNNNIWDYIVSVCYVSFLQSVKLFPIVPPAGIDYNSVRIMNEPIFKSKVEEYSVHILADAIRSVAFTWLATWHRWELLYAERKE